MKKSKKKFLIIWLIIACVIMTACSIYCVVHTYTMLGSAVAVIGGADGPTSVFIAGRIGPSTVLLILTGIAVMVTILYFLIKKFKN